MAETYFKFCFNRPTEKQRTTQLHEGIFGIRRLGGEDDVMMTVEELEIDRFGNDARLG